MKKIHIIDNSLKHSIKNSDESNLFHDSPKLITSTLNTSGTLTSSLKLNTTSTSSKATNLSPMKSASTSQINGIDSALAINDSQIILVNESEKLSTSIDPYLNDGGNLSFEQSLTNLNNDNFIGHYLWLNYLFFSEIYNNPFFLSYLNELSNFTIT